jgi:hypothetical protein
LEPWEKGSRKTAGQTGMCGGVRGVGAGGIVSSAYCLLYKLFTLKLTKKQVIGLITHQDSPYIRGLGFMYIRWVDFLYELVNKRDNCIFKPVLYNLCSCFFFLNFTYVLFIDLFLRLICIVEVKEQCIFTVSF